jgi:hypothetical protein
MTQDQEEAKKNIENANLYLHGFKEGIAQGKRERAEEIFRDLHTFGKSDTQVFKIHAMNYKDLKEKYLGKVE